MSTFDLTTNPFFLLEAGPRADRDSLAAAFDEALAARSGDETRLIAAFHALMLPLPRLQAELGWLGGATSAVLAKALLSGTAPDSAFAALSRLAAANIAAHLCAGDDISAERRELVLSCLAGVQAALDPIGIARAVNDDRLVAGFPFVDDRLVEKGLDQLRLEHRDGAVVALMSLPEPAAMLTRLLRQYGGDERGALFLGELVEAFDNAMLPELMQMSAAIETTVVRLRQNSSPKAGDLAALDADLSAWAKLARPRQLVMAAHLRDEPRSLALGATVRDTVLHIEKHTPAGDGALVLVRAARGAFAALPGLSDLLARDEARLAPTTAPAPVLVQPVATPVFVEPSEPKAAPTGQFAPVPPPPRAPVKLPPWVARLATACRALLWARLGPRPMLRIGLFVGVAAGAFAIVVIAAGPRPHDRAHPPRPAGGTATPTVGEVALFDRS